MPAATPRSRLSRTHRVATGLNADWVDGLDASAIVAAARVTTGLDADTLDGKDLTDVQARFAQVTANAQPAQTRGVPSGGVGYPANARTYDVVFNGDLTNCGLSATITGEDASQITVTPTVAGNEQTTTVLVRTFDGSGTPFNRPFHLVANC